MNLPQLIEGFEDEYKANDNCKDLCCEPCEERSDGTGIEPHQHKHEYGCPRSNPEPEFQERNFMHVAESEDNLFKDEGGASRAQDDERLTREYGVKEIPDPNS